MVSYEMAMDKPVRDAIKQLPCERVIEVHIAGGKVKTTPDGPLYIDVHELDIQQETWQMLDSMLPDLPNVKAVCYECEGAEEHVVLSTLQRLREVVAKRSASEKLRELASDTHEPTAGETL